ncbi:MAG: hypothetical protein ACRDYA_00920 [Egibacteraceae bacterium]
MDFRCDGPLACWRQAFVILTELGAPEAEEICARLEQDDPAER